MVSFIGDEKKVVWWTGVIEYCSYCRGDLDVEDGEILVIRNPDNDDESAAFCYLCNTRYFPQVTYN